MVSQRQPRQSPCFSWIALGLLAGCGGDSAVAPSQPDRAAPAPPTQASPTPPPASSEPASESKPAAPGASGPAEDQGTYALTGTVYFDGKAPARSVIPVQTIQGCDHEGELLTEQYVVEDGRFANVFVHVKMLPAGLAVPPPPAEPVVLDQKGCQYLPHVLGVRVGQKLLVRNSDGISHNVKVDPRSPKNADKHTMNAIQPAGSAPLQLSFEARETLVPFGCTLHPHMNAHVGVVDHPYFAISGADGGFRIEGLPAGTYELEATHEQAGKRSATVQLGQGMPNSVELRFGKR
jgi:plastocyanin